MALILASSFVQAYTRHSGLHRQFQSTISELFGQASRITMTCCKVIWSHSLVASLPDDGELAIVQHGHILTASNGAITQYQPFLRRLCQHFPIPGLYLFLQVQLPLSLTSYHQASTIPHH